MIHLDENKPYNPIKYWKPSNKIVYWGIIVICVLLIPLIIIVDLCIIGFMAISERISQLNHVVTMKVFTIVMVSCILTCCGRNNITSKEDPEIIMVDTICSCPQSVIKLLPYDDFSKQEVEKLMPVLQQSFDKWLYGSWTFEIMEPAHLPQGSYINKRNRYFVTPVLNYQSKLLESNEIIIGLTHKDICTNIHGVKNYGIVGISRPLKQVCLVSDKRLKAKSLYWKPILHEFIHTFYGAKHCPNDNPTCFMKDAKGHGNFEIQDKLCESCKK